MTPEVKAQLSGLLADARDQEASGTKTDLLDRYLAEPYGDEVKGRSAFVDSAASDAVEAILPDVMDVFTSSESIVEFPPFGQDDEDSAREETLAVEQHFWDNNHGFEILYTWMKESMIQQNAYVWRGWVDNERVSIEEYENLTPEEFLAIMSGVDGDYKFLSKDGFSVDENDQIILDVPEDGEPKLGMRIRCTKSEKEHVVEPFPQEDFFVTPRWSKLTLEGVPCCGRVHRDRTIEDWKAFGFSEDSLKGLHRGAEDEEESARHYTRDTQESESQVAFVEVCETYAMLTVDDEPALYRVWCNSDGSKILEWDDGKEAMDEVSEVPIHTLTPYIMPHRHTGQSVVEKVDDIARVKTVLMRQLLDNIYTTNYPRPIYDENQAGENLQGDLANPGPGAEIRTGGALLEWSQPQAMVSSLVPLLDKFENLQEQRTGATRYNQGLDANSLNKTASGISQIMNASQKKAKLIARTFAETGMTDLFLGIHSDLRAGPMSEIMMKIRGQWTAVNPRKWRRRDKMRANVGMGRGDREERRAGLMMTGQVQRELISAGSQMVDEEKLYNTIDGTLQTFGINNVGRYFNDPRTMPPPQPKPERPDPIMISAQAQAQKMQADAQRDAAKMQADERDRERKHQEKMAELRIREAEVMNKIQDDQESLTLDKQKAIMDDDYKRDKLEVDAATGLLRAEAKTVQSEPPLSYSEVDDSNP